MFRTALLIFAGLAAILIIVAYWRGSVAAGNSIFGGLNSLFLTAQGRTQQGQFAAYPGNSPASGSGG